MDAAEQRFRKAMRWLPILILWGLAGALRAAPVPVELAQTPDGWRLMRDGEPFVIRGAGGDQQLALLARCGGNAIRTWGTDNLDDLLDRAHEQGLAVSVGMWLGHPRHGFDYGDADAVRAQFEQAREVVMRYRDHPAVLLWSVGNEMEGDGSDPAIWNAVNQIARLCRELDPRHPTMTVIAEVGGNKIANLHRHCPDVDIVGINSYAGAVTLARRYREAGGTKPFVVTEFGPPGHWEAATTAWGAPRELTSTEKADRYRQTYLAVAPTASNLSLGSFAFLWGAKQEVTATWYGMVLGDGSRLQAVETMTELWGGAPPSNRCPVIGPVTLEPAVGHAPGQTIAATVEVSDPDQDPLTLSWILRQESGQYAGGGDRQAEPPAYPDAILSTGAGRTSVRLPDEEGAFRLFATVKDGHGNAAVANLPLRVSRPRDHAPSEALPLPLVVYGEGQSGEPYAPSGYMGNADAITMDPASSTDPHAGQTCLRVDYGAPDEWGGVVWQSPPGDWGDLPGGYDLTGATALEFWARGAAGGEIIAVSMGLLGPDHPYPDTGRAERKDLRLGREWQRYQVSLSGLDLGCIKTGFAWTVAGQGAPLTFYLDEIRFVGETP